MLVLRRAELGRLLEPRAVLRAVEGAFRARAAGRARALPRAVLPMAGDGLFLAMTAALPRPDVLGTKLVSFVPANRRRGLPTLHASYLLIDARTGVPAALMEAGVLTAIRTGATSALAARHLARPDSRTAVCFGAGVQAGFQLRCLAAVLPLERVEVVGRDPARVRAFCHRLSRALGIPVTVAADPRAAVRGADVVTLATTSPRPVLRGADLAPGAHVDAVGAFRPTTREVDTATVRRARVVVDTYEGCWEEAGDLLIPIRQGAIGRRHVVAELAELVAGRRPGRRRPDEITLFKSVGWAGEDVATARLAVTLARRRGLGRELAL
jgi:ornithine cyclodeaminase/alanine dehydrogenase-like protein (mu-crystallin family)